MGDDALIFWIGLVVVVTGFGFILFNIVFDIASQKPQTERKPPALLQPLLYIPAVMVVVGFIVMVVIGTMN